MNKEYTYIDGKVIVRDEYGIQKQMDYYDNLKDVLLLENTINWISEKVSELEEEKEKYSNKHKHFIPWFLPITIVMSFAIPLVVAGISNIDYLDASRAIPIKDALMASQCIAIISCPLSILGDIGSYIDYRKAKRTEKGIDSELEFLKEVLERSKEEMKVLQENKTRDKENKKFRTEKIEKVKQNNLESRLDVYFDLGYNGDKLYQYYSKGKLNKKLSRYYSNYDIEFIKTYVEEKGPTLVKSKSLKNK